MIRSSALVLAAACTLAGATAASAQQPRFTIAVNGGYQATTTEFDDRFEFTVDHETGSTETTYPIKGAFLGDGGIGVRLWRGLGAGVAVSFFSKNGVGQTTSRVPHPFHFDQHREVVGDAPGLKREERVVHLQLQYQVQATNSLHVTLGVGPSFFDVNQDVVTNVRVTQEFPFDEATFDRADTQRVKESAVGFNVGADFRQMLSRKVAMGLLVRYTRATIDLPVSTPSSRTISVDAGGAQIGLGLRFLF